MVVKAEKKQKSALKKDPCTRIRMDYFSVNVVILVRTVCSKLKQVRSETKGVDLAAPNSRGVDHYNKGYKCWTVKSGDT